MDVGPASGQHGLCGGALPQVPLPTGGAAQLPEDGTEPGHQEGGKKKKRVAPADP